MAYQACRKVANSNGKNGVYASISTSSKAWNIGSIGLLNLPPLGGGRSIVVIDFYMESVAAMSHCVIVPFYYTFPIAGKP